MMLFAKLIAFRPLHIQSCEGIVTHKHIAAWCAEGEKLETVSELKFVIRHCQQIVNSDEHLFLLNKNIRFFLQIFEGVGNFKPKIADTRNLKTSFSGMMVMQSDSVSASGFQLNDIYHAIRRLHEMYDDSESMT
jgi:hypothetical protein